MQGSAVKEPIAEFLAYLPPIQSATSIGGDGASRLKLDVPETEIAEVVKLAAYGRGKVLRVEVYETTP